MLFAVFSLVHLAIAMNAVSRSVRERFGRGVALGVARVLLMLAQVPLVWGHSVWTALLGPSQGTSGDLEMPVWRAAVVLFIGVAGPLVSFSGLYLAYRRAQGVPAAEEERAGRPINAWIGVAAVDAILVVITVAAAIFMSSGPL